MFIPSESSLLWDHFNMLVQHLEGRRIDQVLTCTENSISLLLENDVIVIFSNLEDELIVDLELA